MFEPMCVDSDEPQRGSAMTRFDRAAGVGQSVAEFRTFAPGSHVGVRVRFDSGVDADQHVDGLRRIGDRRQARQLVVVIDDETRNASCCRRRKFFVRLSAAVHHDAVGGKRARSAVANSPSEQTSSFNAVALRRSIKATKSNAFPA